ncbi:MAG: choice-of-anchor B family protein [Flavobacteriia bacterium]|nr:choice-of-anchor B family protein [Flavobacteriia bacterium]
MKRLLLGLLGLASMQAFSQALPPVNTAQLGALPYNTSLNDVWGYADTAGNEYALVGVRNGFSVVDVTNPAAPVEEFKIPGRRSTWRDIKTWDHYAYVMHDPSPQGGGDGLLIVDLDSLTTPRYKFIYPKVVLGGVEDSATRSHNLWVDENGVLYIFGADVGLGGAIMLDVATDPWNPTYLGLYNSTYLHDGYVRGDTLWGAALGNGMVAADISNKTQPQFLAQWNTPSVFAHNCWMSDDNKTIFTTDEVSSAYITAYDVSDLSNVSETDRMRITPNNQTIPHNAHVLGDLVYTSYYTYGLHIMDAQDPTWLMEVGSFDSSPLSGTGYDGAWGAYPYLPSGNLLVTDIQEGLFVISFNETRASRVYAFVQDSLTGQALPMADVFLVNANDTVALDAITAGFRRGMVGAGQDSIHVHASGYTSIKTTFNYTPGLVDTVIYKMLPIDFSVNEAELNGIEMTPNPATDFFTLEADVDMDQAEVILYDMQGREVMRSAWTSGSRSFRSDINMTPGVYVVEVRNEIGKWTERLVVQ